MCVADLEDELIRALGAAAVEQVVAAQGELGSFRTFQKQPAWRGRAIEEQLRRFMGTYGGRKIRYRGVARRGARSHASAPAVGPSPRSRSTEFLVAAVVSVSAIRALTSVVTSAAGSSLAGVKW